MRSSRNETVWAQVWRDDGKGSRGSVNEDCSPCKHKQNVFIQWENEARTSWAHQGVIGESRNSQNSKGNVVSGRRHEQKVGTSSTALCEQKRAGEGALGMGMPTQLRDIVYV